ncbi:hypothetical protein C489_07670 [Natrinema versiforme JCM 10478]|uniref:Uncharacterized protein n=2 Tax=Natrinema versiforme TaxID=88724 RepID=L9Y2M6_9EURY|nr:hypothetical protein C489_07670 [Natrinema versiforme JCM 10478]
MIAGSSSVLAVETIGFSTAGVDRNVRVETVGDADAYLGLTAEGVEDGGVLFEGPTRRPPVAFDVVNQLPEPIAVTLTADGLAFVSADGEPVADDRFVRGATDGERLDPGERIEAVTVGLPPGDDGAAGETVTGSIGIVADGEETRIEADRDLNLERPAITVGAARLDVSQPAGGGFDHRWHLKHVDTGGVALERLCFDYSAIESDGALDFTDADEPSASVTVDGGNRAASIDGRTATTLEVVLESPTPIDADAVEIVLTNAGPPGSLGGGRDSASGAVLELSSGTESTCVEGVWRRS